MDTLHQKGVIALIWHPYIWASAVSEVPEIKILKYSKKLLDAVK